MSGGAPEEERLCLHPYLHWTDAAGKTVRGRVKVLTMLQQRASLPGPAQVELGDGQVYRWRERR